MQQPGGQQAGDDDQLRQCAGFLGTDAIDQKAVDEAQHRAGQDRHSDHEALFGGCQAEGPGDLDAECAQQHPDHEAHVEVQERRKEGGGVPRLEEVLADHCVVRWLEAKKNVPGHEPPAHVRGSLS